ncbi:U1 snRNP protein [Polyrhizophydium stewartii]|uniref:U1 snRNP protein n=1 Tax=Polyrhizophydium stewartii TaxID=2732419 RepID=A0ABR4NG87_9FUNG
MLGSQGPSGRARSARSSRSRLTELVHGGASTTASDSRSQFEYPDEFEDASIEDGSFFGDFDVATAPSLAPPASAERPRALAMADDIHAAAGRVHANRRAAAALDSHVALVAFALEHNLASVQSGSLASGVKTLESLLAEIHHVLSATAKRCKLYQILVADTTGKLIGEYDADLQRITKSLRLEVAHDPSELATAASLDEAGLPSLLQALVEQSTDDFDVASHSWIETLDAIENRHNRVGCKLPESVENKFFDLLMNTRVRIVSRLDRALVPTRRWSVSPENVQIFRDKLIGSGSFGSVFRGRWKSRDVAIKTIHAIDLKRCVGALDDELSRWFPLDHPHVIRLYGACLNADEPFIVMPHMCEDARSIQCQLDEPLMHVRTNVLRGVAAGMRHLHEQQRPIVHGNLRASNVLIGTKPEIVGVSEIGMSLNKINSSANTRHRIDTVRWVAPEAYERGYWPDLPLDVFSFAMTALEILTAKVPFVELARDDHVRAKIRSGERPARPGGIPDALWALIQACWSHDPQTRPTFGEIVERLGPAVHGPAPADHTLALQTAVSLARGLRHRLDTDVASFNAQAAAALVDQVECVAAMLENWASDAFGFTLGDMQAISSVLGDIDRTLDEMMRNNRLLQALSMSSVAAKLDELSRRLVALQKSSLPSDTFDAHAVAKAIEEDEMMLPILAEDLMQIREPGFDLKGQHLETLVAIQQHQGELVGVIPEDKRSQMQQLIDRTRDGIVSQTGQVQGVQQGWVLLPEHISLDGTVSTSGVRQGQCKGEPASFMPIRGDLGNQSVLDAVQAEASQWLALRHENVLRLFGVSLDRDQPLVATSRFVSDVASFICNNSGMGAAQRTQMILGFARGMRHLHEQQPPVVHGSLTSGAVVVDASAHVFVCDFGITAIKTSPAADERYATERERWLAPEVAGAQHTPSRAADVFAFAMVAIEILTGGLPFADEAPSAMIAGEWICDGERPERPAGVSDGLWSVIVDCWQQDPERRPAFGEIVQRLEPLVGM